MDTNNFNPNKYGATKFNPLQYGAIPASTNKKINDTFLTGHSILRGISDLIGTTGLAKGVSQAIFLNFTKEGKDVQKMMEEGKITPDEYDKILGGGLATKGEVVGSGIKTATTILGMGKSAATALGRIGVGAGIGAGYGAGSAIEQGKPIGEIAKQTATGAVIGGVVSGLFEAASALVREVSKTKFVQNKVGNTYNKELQPPKKELTKQIENNFKTFGQEVSNVVDDAGKPVYVGSYRDLMQKAKNELSVKGDNLNKFLESISKTGTTQTTKKEIAGDIIKIMENNYGKLTPSQLKQISFEISRMPNKMDLTGVEKIKRLYDSLIPDSFWEKIGDPAVSFPSLVKYTLRDNAKNIINQKAGQFSAGIEGKIIQQLNKEMGIAMDVKHLAASQLAQRASSKIGASQGGGGYFYLIRKLIDDYIFNPQLTTRGAQFLKNMGTKVGQTPLRQATRLGITKELTE
jgi:hypothetical protein